MTFVSKGPKYPRVYESTIKQLGRLGPGSYDPDRSFRKQVHQHPVFMSAIDREREEHLESKMRIPGPGAYQLQNAHVKFLVKKQPVSCQSAFKSLIQRFPQKKHNESERATSQIQKNIYKCLIDDEDAKRKGGKLYGVIREHNKINNSIPSIPTVDQSYGYRIDHKTKKLVQNQNPNVLLARRTFIENIDPRLFQTVNAGYGGPGSYFIKDNKKIKGPLWVSHQKEKQNYNNIKAEVQVRQSQIQSEAYQKKWENKRNLLVNKQTRFVNGGQSKKSQLLLNSLKRRFEPYINNSEDIQKIIDERLQQKRVMITKPSLHQVLPNKQQNSKVQCFMSKSSRVQKTKQEQKVQIAFKQSKIQGKSY